MSDYDPKPKDHERMRGIYERAGSLNGLKAIQLADQMAKAIKDPKKACRRGAAAWAYSWAGYALVTRMRITKIFYERAIELGDLKAGGLYALLTTDPNTKTSGQILAEREQRRREQVEAARAEVDWPSLISRLSAPVQKEPEVTSTNRNPAKRKIKL